MLPTKAEADQAIGDGVAAQEARAERERYLSLNDRGDGTYRGVFVVSLLHGRLLQTARAVVDELGELLEHLTTVTGAGALDLGAPISARAVRRLACNAGHLRVVLGGEPLPLDLGRLRRWYTRDQSHALATVHDTCGITGRTRPFVWCELHHLRKKRRQATSRPTSGRMWSHDHLTDGPGRLMRVGLTGGVASGKSTVSTILEDLGAVIIDSDVIAREVVAPGTSGLSAVVAAFGPQVLTKDGELDRPAMGRLVFNDDAARARLEAVVHPRVRARAAEVEAAAPRGALVVHDIPLLVETGQGERFQHVVVVDAPTELQVERMVSERGWSQDDAASRIAAQAPREERLAVATHVIENTGSLEDLRRRVEEVHAALTASTSS